MDSHRRDAPPRLRLRPATTLGGGRGTDGSPQATATGDHVRARPMPEPAESAQPPTPSLGDADGWLVRAGSGDEGAFARVYDALAPRVYGLARRVLVDPAQAEEVTQEVFVEVWRTAPRFDPERGSAAGWVTTIAHRRAVDRVRSEAAGRARAEHASRQSDPDDGFDVVGEAVTGDDERRRVSEALRMLTPLEREAIELTYYRGYTHREAAERLGAPLGTVKARLRAGLARLRGVLEDER